VAAAQKNAHDSCCYRLAHSLSNESLFGHLMRPTDDGMRLRLAVPSRAW
jgi:hypothetical protein